MLKNFPKTVLTARVEPALKEQLTAEAAQHDMTLSNYTEHVLRYFNTVLYDLQVSDEKNHSLQNQVNRLASDNNELCLDNEKWSALNVQLTSDKLTLSEGLQRYRGRIESLASQVNDLSSLNTEQDAQINDLIDGFET
jgi:hypothetical protein